MSAIWSASKSSSIPLHSDLVCTADLPWTVSYVIRKLTQLDSFRELPKEKRPPDKIIWRGTAEDLDDWFDKVFDSKKSKPQDSFIFNINEDDIG